MLRRLVLVSVLAALVSPASAADAASADKETLYALGVALTQSLKQLNLKPDEVDEVTKGLRDGLLGKANEVNLTEFRTKFQELAKARAEESAKVEKEASKAFLAKAGAEKGAVKTDSGMIYQEIKAGTGKSPAATDKVQVHYHGTLIDGTVFDSSVDRGTPATFPLNGVIKCWTEGVQKMKEGGKAKLICPSDIAYGDRGSPPKIKPGATLVFEVELLKIEAPAPAAAAPAPAPAAK